MGKKTYNNYDNTLFGQYIRQLENADSAGWDTDNKIWLDPQKKGFDARNRGMGVDVLNNNAAAAVTAGRSGQYLTEEEENYLRNKHIDYLLGVIGRRKLKENPALNNMSPKKQAQVMGILYRGDAEELWNENSVLGKALISKKDNDMDAAIKEFYNLKGLGERAKNDSIFWSDRSSYNLHHKIIPQLSSNNNVEKPDALKISKSTVIPSTARRDTKKAMQDKVDFHNFMDSISIQRSLPPTYTPRFSTHSEGGYIEYPDWNSLPMAEKAAMIKVAVGNGITNLQDIRDRYNEFAWGGPSEAAKKRIERWEGKAMTGAKDPLSGKYARNSSFEDEAKRFYSVLPKNIREQVLSNPELADNLYSYSYNVGAGNFKKRVVPALQRYYAGKGSVEDIQRSMWASGDTKLRGLQRRRAEERAGVGRALLSGDMPIPAFYTETATTGNEGFIPFNPMIPEVFGAEQPIEAPVTIENIPPTIQKPEEPVYSPEEIERQERAESLANLSRIFSLMNGTSENSGMLGALNLLAGNYANGGKIHIKPSHRGRLTELKERTGKTEAELYNDGNPAHKKMVVFARNSRKWKHGLGGNLYPDGGYVREVNGHPIAFDYEGNLVDQVTGEKGYMPLPEVSVIANPDDVARGRARRWYEDFGIESNVATSVADGRKQNSHLDERGIEGAVKAAAWAKDHPILNNVGLGLSTLPLAVAATPAVVGGGELAATALANPYVDAALTSMGGAHAAQSLANGEANWMTALELAPLGRLARPLYEEVVQPGIRLFNSPLTGNWTKIGNKEYRLSPNSLGANGSPIESRGIAPQITAENAASIQYQIEQNMPSALEETAKSVEKGRNTLLDWIRSPFYKARLEDEPLYRVADDVVADAGKMIEEVPVDISKTKLELDPSGRINGVTKTRPAIQTQLPDGTTIVDLNTGLDVNVASDLGKDADETTLHELLHYMTANSKGTPISKAGEKIIEKGWMNPTETHFDAINIIHNNRSKGWQDYILDQNNALLPQYDPVVKMVMEEPNKAIYFLEKAGKNTQDAQKAIQSLRSRYSTWYDIQEQRAYLQQLFHSKIRPNIKNPNDATEIEEYLSLHPEILENFPAYKHIQEVRPGSLKDYAKYFSAALGTIPYIFKTPSKDE